jgi:hypothetical protein
MLVIPLLPGLNPIEFYSLSPIFPSRWKRDENGAIVYRRLNVYERSKPVLEFVAIRRCDTKQWALPGV